MNAPAFNYPSWLKVIEKNRKEPCAELAKVDINDTPLHKKRCFPLKISLINMNKSPAF